MFTEAPPTVSVIVVPSSVSISLVAPDSYVNVNCPFPVLNISPWLNFFVASVFIAISLKISFIIMFVNSVLYVPVSSVYVTFNVFVTFPFMNSDAAGVMFIFVPSVSVIVILESVIETPFPLSKAPLAYVRFILPPIALKVPL